MRYFVFLLVAVLIGGCGTRVNREMRTLFVDYIGDDVPGAAILVVRDGEKIFAETYGMANLETDESVRPNTNFRLASVTKQFTAMSILMLVDRGQLDLDRSVTNIFTDAPPFMEGVTITHLLQHTSGLLDYEDFVPSDSPTQVKDRDVVGILFQTDSLYFPPGSEYRYSNSGYAMLAVIVEEVSGQRFADFLEANIFRPVGMNGTVAFEEGVSTVPNRAIGYSVEGDQIEDTDQSPWSAVLGDGGIYSSIDDLYKWDQALYADDLISPELLELGFTPNLETYGFGWRIDSFNGHKRYHHSGSTSGFRNFMQRFPDDRLTVIVLTNRADPSVDPLGERVATRFLGD